MDEAAIENCVEVSTIQRPPVEPNLRGFRYQVFQMPARWSNFPANGGVHTVIVMKHGRRAEELQRPDQGVSQDMRHGHGCPAESDLNEDHADLCKRCKRERCLDVG